MSVPGVSKAFPGTGLGLCRFFYLFCHLEPRLSYLIFKRLLASKDAAQLSYTDESLKSCLNLKMNQ